MIKYRTDASEIDPTQLSDQFFEHWPNQPSPETHLRLLRGSHAIVLALDATAGSTGHVVGFVNAVSDGVLSAYIPLLEVLPEWRGRGIGGELMRRLMEQLDGLYMIDLLCEEDVIPFYEQLDVGLKRSTGMAGRNYTAQSGQTP